MTNIHPVDTHVGNLIRKRRKQLGLSQHALATRAGVTFQQIQKYERASNRISASRLYAISRALGVGLHFFFDGISEESDEWPVRDVDVHGFTRTPDGFELARYFGGLTPAKRRGVLTLVRAIVSDQHEEPGDPV